VLLCAVSELVVGVDAGEVPSGLVIEAEHFEIPYFADWTPQKGLGWYAKEHIHGSGRGVAICDEHSVGAEMLYRLPKPLPPGKHFLYVLYYPMHGGGENRIDFTLGTVDGQDFRAAASQPLSWSKKAFYTWAELAFETTVPVNALKAKATKIERKSIGDVPDQPYAMIFLDSLYLAGRAGLKFPGRHRYWSLDLRAKAKAQTQATGKPRPDKPSPFGEVVEGVNLVRNGGFEVGVLPYWFGWKCDRWVRLNPPPGVKERPKSMRLMWDNASTTLTPENLVQQERHEGTRSLHLKLEKGWQKEVGDQRSCGIASFPFPVKEGKFTVSFWAKPTDGGVQYICGLDNYGKIGRAYSRYFYQAHGRILGTFNGELKEGWARYQQEIAIKQGAKEALFWFFAFGKERADVFLDDVQVVMGEPAEAKMRLPEVGVVSPVVGRVYYDTKPVTFKVLADGPGSKLKCRFRVTNVFRDEVEKGSLKLRLSEGHGQAGLSLKLRTRGSYLFEIWPAEASEFTSQLAFHIIPPPKKLNRTGVISSRANCEAVVRFFERAGIRYNAYLWDQQFMWKSCNPEKGKYIWYDEIRERKARAGIQEVPWLWTHQTADWSRDPKMSPIGINGSNLNWPSPEAYGKFVQDMVGHYKGIRHWILGDELDLQIEPKKYAPYLIAALNGLSKANPEARGVPSGSPLWSERLYNEIGWAKCDTLGGSYHNMPEGLYWQERELLEKHGKPRPWHIGVGWGCRSLYTFSETEFKTTSPFPPCLRTAQNIALQCAVVAPEFYTQYTTRYGPPDPFNFFEFDGSFKAQGITYVLVLDFLADADRGDKIINQNAGERVKAFWVNKPGGIAVATWGLGDLKVDVPADKVRIRDVFTNPIPFPKKGLLRLDAKSLYFIEDRGLGKEALLSAIETAEVKFPNDTKCVILPGAKRGEIDLGVLLRRERAASYCVEVGERWLEERPLNHADPEGRYRAAWPRTLAQGGGRATFDLRRGEERLVRFPLFGRWVGKRSLNNLDLDVWLTEADGLKKRLRGGWAAKGLWVVSAMKAKGVVLDGNLDEWDDRLPSFVYASQRLSGNYQHKQTRHGSWRVKERPDASVRLLAAYDDSALHFGIRVRDDDLQFADADEEQPADRLELLFDTDLLGDVQSHQMDEDDRRLVIGPGFREGDQELAILSGGIASQTVPAWIARTRDGYVVELSVPWSALCSMARLRAYGMGFEARLIDADGSLEKKSELVLSGNGDYPHNDPRGWAQLLLVD